MRSDNGLEFTAAVFPKQLTKIGIKPIRISSSSPWENGYRTDIMIDLMEHLGERF